MSKQKKTSLAAPQFSVKAIKLIFRKQFSRVRRSRGGQWSRLQQALRREAGVRGRSQHLHVLSGFGRLVICFYH
jgi:hypothetical protein